MVELQAASVVTVKTTAKERDCPLVRLKLLHSTLAPFTMQPESEAPALNVSPEGIGSAIVTFVAVPGPAFVAVREYVMTLPCVTEAGPVLLMERSAPCTGQVSCVVVCAKLLAPLGSLLPAASTVAVFRSERGVHELPVGTRTWKRMMATSPTFIVGFVQTR